MLRRINVSFAAVLHLLHLLHIRPPLVLSSVVRAPSTHAQHPHPHPPTPAHIYIINTRLLLYTRFAEFFIPFCAD